MSRVCRSIQHTCSFPCTFIVCTSILNNEYAIYDIYIDEVQLFFTKPHTFVPQIIVRITEFTGLSKTGLTRMYLFVL